MSRMVVMLLLWAGSAYAQTRVSAPEREACPRCEIRLTRLFTLGAEDGERAITGVPRLMVKDSRGRYLLVTEKFHAEIQAFDARGRPLGRVGREGAGPGEFKSVWEMVVVPGDTVYVFDRGNGRVTILTPEWEYARTIHFPHWIGKAVMLGDGRIVANAFILGKDRVGLPLQLIGPDGHVERSFGAEGPVSWSDAPNLRYRWVAPNGPDRVWSVHMTQYVIESWTLDGTLERSLVRDAPWFPPTVRRKNATPTRPPEPFMWAFKADERGRLWPAVVVADPDYARAMSSTPHVAEGQEYYDITGELNEYYDGIIEVIDPDRGRVVARKRLHDPPIEWVGPDELATYRAVGGVPYIDVWRVELIHPVRKHRR